MMRAGRSLLGLIAAALVAVGCNSQNTPIGLDQYVNQEFGFAIAVPSDMANAGWLIVRAQDATVRDAFVPPDTSSWEPVAVVAPPSGSYPLLSPFFVNIFRPKNATVSVTELVDTRVTQVGDLFVSRRQYDAGSEADGTVTFDEIIFGDSNDRIYEAFAVSGGLGYAVRTSGAPLGSNASAFFVDLQAFRRVVQTFRLITIP